ncbi:AAA family ATPase [Kineosporia sp. A_224]|uniref:AAA family ATPase n=1 Tax=Kineosporia sp. A_224 TaxID=1962180 RepID=UPI001E5F3069|nr:AAA family ATPase [Kineosporia sp. A_224]
MARRREPSRHALPVRRVEAADGVDLPRGTWPRSVPAVDQLLTEGLDLGPVTVLVGENGSGKSTLVEAVAAAYGLNPEGGSTNAMHSSRRSESALHEALRVSRGLTASKWGFFLRAETMHGLYTYLENLETLGDNPDDDLHEMSHGESFAEILARKFRSPGLYVLDEPESALSFSACLGLVGLLADLAASGRSQVVLATHSPVVAAVPGATILQLDEDGYHEVAWEDLALVEHYRRFLEAPQRYLRHVLADD